MQRTILLSLIVCLLSLLGWLLRMFPTFWLGLDPGTEFRTAAADVVGTLGLPTLKSFLHISKQAAIHRLSRDEFRCCHVASVLLGHNTLPRIPNIKHMAFLCDMEKTIANKLNEYAQFHATKRDDPNSSFLVVAQSTFFHVSPSGQHLGTGLGNRLQGLVGGLIRAFFEYRVLIWEEGGLFSETETESEPEVEHPGPRIYGRPSRLFKLPENFDMRPIWRKKEKRLLHKNPALEKLAKMQSQGPSTKVVSGVEAYRFRTAIECKTKYSEDWSLLFGDLSDMEVYGMVLRWLIRPNNQLEEERREFSSFLGLGLHVRHRDSDPRWSQIQSSDWLGCAVEAALNWWPETMALRWSEVEPSCLGNENVPLKLYVSGDDSLFVDDLVDKTVSWFNAQYPCVNVTRWPRSNVPRDTEQNLDGTSFYLLFRDLFLLGSFPHFIGTFASTFSMSASAMGCTLDPYWVGEGKLPIESADVLGNREGASNCHCQVASDGVKYSNLDAATQGL